MHVEYVIVNIWRRKASENVQAGKIIVSQSNVTTDNVLYIYLQ